MGVPYGKISTQEIMTWALNHPRCVAAILAPGATCYYVWTERNSRKHGGSTREGNEISRCIKKAIATYLKERKDFCKNCKVEWFE